MSEYRDAQHARLSESIHRWATDLRALEATRDVELSGLDSALLAQQAPGKAREALQRKRQRAEAKYQQQMLAGQEMLLRLEREYRAATTGVDVGTLSRDDLRSELIAAVLEGISEFTYGEAVQLRDAFAELAEEIETENQGNVDWID